MRGGGEGKIFTTVAIAVLYAAAAAAAAVQRPIVAALAWPQCFDHANS